MTLTDAAAQLGIPVQSLRALEWNRGDLLATPDDANRIEQQYAVFLGVHVGPSEGDAVGPPEPAEGLEPAEAAQAPGVEQPFELVLLCTGNRARSPIAEAFFRDLLVGLPVRVRSLGTLEQVGAPPLREARKAASRVGLDISAHRSRALAGEDLSQADLVLGFERSHLAAAVVDGGAATERVFTLPELVQLIDVAEPAGALDPIERARETIAHAHAQRGGELSRAPAELADPIGRNTAFHRDTVEQLRELSARVAAGLFGVSEPAGSEAGTRRGTRKSS